MNTTSERPDVPLQRVVVASRACDVSTVLTRAERDRKPYIPDGINFSALPYCMRLVSYQRFNIPPTNLRDRPEWAVGAGNGDDAHDWLQRRYLKYGLVQMAPWFSRDPANDPGRRARNRAEGILEPAIEMRLDEWSLTPEQKALMDQYYLHGRIDLLFKNDIFAWDRDGKEKVDNFPEDLLFRISDELRQEILDDGRPLVGEIKSVSLEKVRDRWWNLNIQSSYMPQLQMAMWALNLEFALLVVVLRDANMYDTMEYVVRRDPAYIKYQLGRCAHEVAQHSQKKLSRAEPGKGHYCKKICKWENHCLQTRDLLNVPVANLPTMQISFT